MSKSASLIVDKNFSREDFKIAIKDFLTKENEENEFLISYQKKWIWCFYPGEDGNVEIQFSNDLSQDERISFICELRKSINFKVDEADI